MKVPILISILITLLSSVNCYSQKDKYHDLLDYVVTHFDPPKSVTDVCEWQAALVKITTNNKGKVIGVDLLNKASDKLKNSFNFLLGYKFPQSLNAANKTIVFCETLQNESSECYKERQMTAEEGMHIIYGAFIKQIKQNPKTIFLETTLHISSGPTNMEH